MLIRHEYPLFLNHNKDLCEKEEMKRKVKEQRKNQRKKK
jgi:hypothetical protein